MGIARKLADLLDNDGDVKLDKQRPAYAKPTNENINYISGLQSALNDKVDDIQVLTNVPSGALFTDTVYTHPTNHAISEVSGLQSALDGKTTEAYVNTQVAGIVNTAPATLDTLNELAQALGDDPNYATTTSNLIGTKAPQSTTYTKTETDAKIVALSPPATKAHIDSLNVNAATLNGIASTSFARKDALTGDLSLGDNVRAKFGASDDLQIYHDGTASYVRNFGTGSLFIAGDADGDVFIQGKAGENSIGCFNDGAVQLYYDNAQKLATTSTGINVTGTVTGDGLTVAGDATIGGSIFHNNFGNSLLLHSSPYQVWHFSVHNPTPNTMYTLGACNTWGTVSGFIYVKNHYGSYSRGHGHLLMLYSTFVAGLTAGSFDGLFSPSPNFWGSGHRDLRFTTNGSARYEFACAFVVTEGSNLPSSGINASYDLFTPAQNGDFQLTRLI